MQIVTDEELQRDITMMAQAAGERFSISCVGIDAATEDNRIRSFIQAVQGLS